MAQGDYNQRLEIKREDEVGELTDAFNKMAVKLRKTWPHYRKAKKSSDVYWITAHLCLLQR